ncbi:hypothetical protein [Nocardia asteroides]|uniref:hypothetical protein n=1 Tax=Nocardia asteroides TaxID=1824 RepID=UPI001E4D79F9|nr:hypothetical protein [Nocardia asteroides]UGT54423.1 hypothetical protein LTT85_27930 [Nocardia asteroides]
MPDTFVWDEAGNEEFRQARRLEQVSLFAELNLDYDEIVRTRDLLGQVIREYRLRLGLPRLLDKFPALTLTTLIGHAGLDYEQGKYWESFWSELDLEREQEFENLLRARLPVYLRKFKMRVFPDLGTQYVQMMAVHAGIPVHCLGDLVDVIEQHVAQGRYPSGAAVFEWLTQPGLEYRMNDLDVPVRNFLKYGGEVAVDIVDRIIEFAGYTREHPDFANDLNLDTATTGIPSLLLDALIERWEERPFGAAAVIASRAPRQRRPVLSYSRADDQIILEVPYPVTSAESPWLVSLDGETTTVHARRGWGLSAGEAQPPTPMPVYRQAREVVLRHEESGQHYRISLVDKADPLLIFDERGAHLSRHVALPREQVVAVHPARATLREAHSGSALEHSAEATPVGWRDWVARVYDLIDIDAVVLDDDARTGTPRQVRRTGSARLVFPDPVEGLYTRSGLAVYAERSSVDLPPHAVEPVEWRVRVRHSGTVDWLADAIWESDTEPVSLDPFEGIAPGLLGLFDVVISGPLGQDLRHSVFLAEGLVVEHAAEFRIPVQDGLAPTSVAVTAAAPLGTDRSEVGFGSAEREANVVVTSHGLSEQLVIRPPAVELRVDAIGAVAAWRTVAPVLTVEDLAEYMIVAARVPGNVQVDMVLTDDHGTIRQTVCPKVARDNVFHASTREFSDTARSMRRSRIVLRIDTVDGATTEVTLARIQPRRLCTAVRLEGAELVFDGATDSDLAAFVWPCTAPWQAPIQVELIDGRATLPDEYVGAGPLTVQVFVDDPWSVITAPEQPDETADIVEQPGWMPDDDLGRAELARFLAGAGDLPGTSSAVPEAWTVFVGMPGGRGWRPSVRSALLEVLRADPRSSVEALDRSTISRSDVPALLIASGLIDRDLSSPIRSDTLTDPWLGCLVGIADLPYIALHSSDPIPGVELRAELVNYGGEHLLNLLSGDPRCAYSDIFDADTVPLHFMPDEQFAALKQACEIVPAALLDGDTRRSAVFEAFAQRRRWQEEPAQAAMTVQSAELMPVLRRASAAVYDVVKARNEALTGADTTQFPWLLLSMQSLLFAAVARLCARSMVRGWSMPAPMRESWARLAQLCPALVCADILIADALASYALHHDLVNKIGVPR